MQLGDPTVLDTSSGEAVAAHEGGNGGGEVISGAEGNSGEFEKGGGGDEGEKSNNFGGNRWPRQETLALLKIRSDMDAVFRDSSLKGPLWEQVSRKLAELGYQRSAKKCKEKFENVYKYHRRTKESRRVKSEGKTYKFFDQLQALESQFRVSYPPKQQPPTPPLATLPTRPPSDHILTTSSFSNYVPTTTTTTVPSTNPIIPTLISPSPPPSTTTTNIATTTITSTATLSINPRNPPQTTNNHNNHNHNNNNNNNNNVTYSLPNIMNNLFSSTSSSTASDEDLEEKYRKKRKWKEYFRRLTRQILAKQEEMQKKFLEAIDKREREQVAQQDAWRMQEMARINREHEILVQERSTTVANGAAVIAFLQKLSGQQNPPTTQPPPSPPPPPSVTQLQLQTQLQQQQQQQRQTKELIPHPQLMANNSLVEIEKMNNGSSLSSSRWPKTEVHALIRLRTSLETKYLENGPKAPLWEDISAGMQRLGYNRSAKRCKEKWENINKYFKKVKESKRQRREDSKTCPYYYELDALYKEKSKTQNNPFGASIQNIKPNEMMEPLMVQPEQQWRPPQLYEQVVTKENAGEYEVKQRDGGEEDDDESDDDGVDEDEEETVEDEEGGSNRYEITTNKLSSVDTVE